LWIFVFATTLIFGGIRSSITPAYLLTVFMAGFLLGEPGALAFGGLSILAILGVFFAEFYFDAVLRPPRAQVAWDNAFLISAIFGWMTVVVLLGWRNFANTLDGLRRSKEALRERVEELHESRKTIRARTEMLERRTLQLQAAAEVARDATALRDIDTLLKRAISQIQDRFEIYHAALFLLDDSGEYVVLRTAAGQSADATLASGLQLRVGGNSMVGGSAATGEGFVSPDVRQEPLYKADPLLSETRSEAILPLRTGGEIIGVLDVQSRELAAFPKDTIAVLQIVADQLAVAIENARLLEETQTTVRELMAASGQYTREAWADVAVEEETARGYRYDRLGVAPLSHIDADAPSTTETSGGLAVPLKLREEVIGLLNLRFEDEHIPPETTEFLEGVAERLALSMENARLLEASRERAARERLVSEITAELRATADVQGVLRRTIQELGKALHARGTVRMVPAQRDGDDEIGKEVQ
jgi:GAF domain-containing protein